jgi:hypothetical protein
MLKMKKCKSILLTAAVSLLSLQFATSYVQAASAKHAINTQGTGSVKQRVSCDVVKKNPALHLDQVEACDLDQGEGPEKDATVVRSKSNLSNN